MRIIRALAAALTLAGLTFGVPVALVAFGRLPGGGDLAELPTRMLDDRTAFALLTALAWLAWAWFALTVAGELVAQFTDARWRLPVASPFQAGARRLVAALTMSASLAGPIVTRTALPPALPATATVATDAGPRLSLAQATAWASGTDGPMASPQPPEMARVGATRR